MNRDLLAKMLASVDGLEREGDHDYRVSETRAVELMQRGAVGGAVTLPRAERVRLEEGYVALETREGTFLLPYAEVVGLKIGERGGAAGACTGFLR